MTQRSIPSSAPQGMPDAACACIDALDSQFMKALAEPARLAILKLLVIHRRMDVGAVARECPQDRSVVLRHLQVLERAGVVHSESVGRHTFYVIDGNGVSEQLQRLTSLVSELRKTCCP